MLRLLVIGVLLASFMIPWISGSTQTYSIQFNTHFISGTDQPEEQGLFIAIDGKTVANGAFEDSGSLSTSITLNDSSPHSVTAWPHSDHPKANDPDDDYSLYGGNLSVNGMLCATSDDVWAGSPLTCSLPPTQPVPEFSNALVLPMALFLIVGISAVTKKRTHQVADEIVVP